MNRMIQKGEGSMKIKTHLPVASNRTTTVGIFAGIIAALIMSFTSIIALTSLVRNHNFLESSLELSVFLVRMVAVLLGVLIGTGLIKERCIVVAGIVAAGYLVLLLALGILIYDGSFENFGTGVLSTVIGSVLGGLIRLKLQNKPSRSKKIKL